MIEQEIFDSIQVASDNDPLRPEFPSDNPRFPASETYKINVPGFSNVWLKDESTNSTGTHKDRMGWEIVVTYRDIIRRRLEQGYADKKPLPRMSLISSGSAASAIQLMLRKYHLPDLKVLVDSRIDKPILASLNALGCEVYHTDLSARLLTTADILDLTNNTNGLDVTSNNGFDPNTRFYDWMSYEVLNSQADYCFIPFGTGNLYQNILNIAKKEINARNKDPRLQVSADQIGRCHFFGATTSNSQSLADKLYSPFSPFQNYSDQWLRFYIMAGYCGELSGVQNVSEKFFEQAYDLALEQKISCEYSGVAGLALLLQMSERIPTDAKILIVNTGKLKLFS